MKNSYKLFAALLLSAPALTGCIEEAIPTNTVIQSQVMSQQGAEAFLWGMPSHMNVIGTCSTDQHYDFGQPALMHIRDCLTEDMVVDYAGGYNWFGNWCRVGTGMGANYMATQFIWNWYYAQIQCCNNTIGAIDVEANELMRNENSLYKAIAYGYRAATYLEAARMYEVLPAQGFTGKDATGTNNIIGLTIPIVTEETTDEQLRENPRRPHAEMVDFIMGDLDAAEELFNQTSLSRPSKTMPSLAVVYGLKSRVYLWDASFQEEINSDLAAANAAYNKAAEYARKAIAESGAAPLTEAQWVSPTSGFNDLSTSSWMWGGQYAAEDDAVVAGGIRTWTSFCCNEEVFGYAAPEQGAITRINAALYNKINDRDFRKLSYIGPEGSKLNARLSFIDPAWAAENLTIPYTSLKFRPGSGNMSDPTVGAVVGYPLMRVEEMYFIEAEAKAHVNPAEGMNLLKDFMKTYRYAAYNPMSAADKAAAVEEIVLQKRIELWGEGQSFYDAKRLNLNCTRYYDGTNFEIGADTYNTVGRPGWMNIVIVAQEVDNNDALQGYNTPSPVGVYQALGLEE